MCKRSCRIRYDVMTSAGARQQLVHRPHLITAFTRSPQDVATAQHMFPSLAHRPQPAILIDTRPGKLSCSGNMPRTRYHTSNNSKDDIHDIHVAYTHTETTTLNSWLRFHNLPYYTASDNRPNYISENLFGKVTPNCRSNQINYSTVSAVASWANHTAVRMASACVCLLTRVSQIITAGHKLVEL